MADFVVKCHDLLPAFRVPILADGAALDLTLAVSADFIMKSATGTVTVNKPAVIEVPKTSGIVRYDWATPDTDTAGTYTAEVEIHWPSSKPQTAPTDSYWTIEIPSDLDGAA